MSIETSLQELSLAHGPRALAEAHARLQGEARRERKAADRAKSVFIGSVLEAMRLWEVQKADGVPLNERVMYFERTLRLAWPQTSGGQLEKPRCPRCDVDSGSIGRECPGDDSCGRSRPHLPHSFIEPCSCSRGNRYKDRPRQDDDFTHAGKTKPRSGWSRAGR